MAKKKKSTEDPVDTSTGGTPKAMKKVKKVAMKSAMKGAVKKKTKNAASSSCAAETAASSSVTAEACSLCDGLVPKEGSFRCRSCGKTITPDPSAATEE
mmetsp:Transcript_102668/g.182412  ORF Transcript_102668/g.182412 Transcript_102668/m.182412 type:complete len:99 (-) Transcript_102668:62-358(-)